MKKRTFILTLIIFLGLVAAMRASAQCTFNGSITAGDSTHSNALNTSGVNSTVALPQVCPGVFTTTGPTHYDRYDFINSNAVGTDYEVTSNATGCTAERSFLFGSAYIGSVDLINLCNNYAASMGMGYADVGTYSFTVPAGSLFSLVVEEFDPNIACASYTLTVTPCPDVAPSPSPTPTGTPSGSIAGTVNYGNAIGSPATRTISNVLLSGAGSANVSTTTTFPGGTYTLIGFGSGLYTVTPSKTGSVNGSITSFDAAKIAQHAAGSVTLAGNQLVVADVSGNGSVSSFDAAQLAKYVVATPPYGSTGNWVFTPANNVHASVTTNISGEDYSGLLMGEVSGNWVDSGARPDVDNGSERSVAVTAPSLVTPADGEVFIPVIIEGAADKGIISYEFDLRYDPSVIEPQKKPVELTGTASSKLLAVANTDETGLLRVAVYGAKALEANGVLLNLRFTAVGAPGSMSPLTWERIMLNEGDPMTTAASGQIELSAAAPNQAEISGRILTTFGEGVPNARVTLTDTSGQILAKAVVTYGFGYYRFGGLDVGHTYTINVESRGRTFTPLTVSVYDQLLNVDMISQQ